ncbi:MAG TPA: HAD family phosphatase [Humisphaera sp.]|jgi:putative hydrolase of the HAD superfamily|nr:HAD family phosphatase [Humisphaera sp.]
MPDDPSIRLVCFDLGRVLVRICDDWQQACGIAAVPFPAVLADRAVRERFQELTALGDVGKLGFDEFLQSASQILSLPADQIRAAQEAYLRPAYTGSIELLDQLSARGIKTACLSNTSENHWRIMSDPGHTSHVPLHKLDYQFASHLVGHRKPDAAIYEHVERTTGFAGEQILFFDDVIENVQAATRRGWHAHRIDPAPDDPIPQIRAVLARFNLRHDA